MGQRISKAILLGTTLFLASTGGGFAQGLAGPYLAGTSALIDGNFDAAAPYFVRAMSADPSNLVLKQNALLSFVAAGDFKVAASIASVMPSDEGGILADLVMMVNLANKGDFTGAQARLPVDDTQMSSVLKGLLEAWLMLATGDSDAAISAFDAMDDNETVKLFGQYHKGMALAYLGDFAGAADVLDGENGPLHINRGSIVAHVQVLAELGRISDAVIVLDDAIARGFSDAQLIALRQHVAEGKPTPFTQVTGPTYGMAEAFETIADALDRDEPNRTALFYARLAQELQPNYEDAAFTAATMLTHEGQYGLAEAAYATISITSPSYLDAQIGRSETLRLMDDNTGATEVLKALAIANPNDVVIWNELGEIHRSEQDFAEAEAAYTRAIGTLDAVVERHWVLFYSRGITFERLGDWDAAEADFRYALVLSPDQPFVLNYLGYSFIEMNINLNEALGMIETAAARMPDNGFITDSLAWVLYRLGQFEEAVAPMERAAELLPVDPIVNDHLGDVFWQVGRKTEARFQWRRAQSFGPEEVDAARIKRKLEVGLDVVLAEESAE